VDVEAFWGDRAGELEEYARLALRVGVNVSEVVVDADDIYGIGVNLAARLTGLASPGEIVVSPEVRDVLVDGLDADLEDMGECYVKHLDEPLRAFRLHRAVAPRLPAFEPDQEPDMRAVVAVVPFEFRGGLRGAEYEAIGELIADGVIALLSKSSSVRLISRLSSSVFRGRAAELETVAQRLGAAYVLSGEELVRFAAGADDAAGLASHDRDGSLYVEPRDRPCLWPQHRQRLAPDFASDDWRR